MKTGYALPFSEAMRQMGIFDKGVRDIAIGYRNRGFWRVEPSLLASAVVTAFARLSCGSENFPVKKT